MSRHYFLTNDERSFFEAVCETVVPAGKNVEKDPGAITVGGLEYIDSTLLDSPPARQAYYREAIGELDALCSPKFHKKFAELDQEKREEAFKQFYLNPETREMMFDLRSIALEAFYSDFKSPAYQGMSGWEYSEFGGKGISDLKKDWSFLKIWRDKE